MPKFYITTAIPYVNARPHIGHALEFIQADVIARHKKQQGDDVYFLSGSDDNALKNVQAAEKEGLLIQEFINQNAALFYDLAKKLNVEFDVFQKGSSREHYESSQKLWKLCEKAGDIYKKSYEGLYCVGCETFYTPDELNENQECFEHPGRKLEKVAEENYFFKLSSYQDKLIDLLEKDEMRIVPSTRKNEVLSFLKQPLQDISISRSNERAKNWGVPVPDDDSQRMYVWFDALNIYQSGVGFGLDEEKYKKWWPADVHVIGKGITRFHAVYWPAFLLSAGLSLPKTIFVHGYITANGQKMSKSLGNVVDPLELVQKYGADAVRYFFLSEIPPTEDGDFSYEKFESRYNADLANNLGNQVKRVLDLAIKYEVNPKFPEKDAILQQWNEKGLSEALENFEFNKALELIFHAIPYREPDEVGYETSSSEYPPVISLSGISGSVEARRPFDLGISEEQRKKTVEEELIQLWYIAIALEPFLPATAEKIQKQLQTQQSEILFPRLS